MPFQRSATLLCLLLLSKLALTQGQFFIPAEKPNTKRLIGVSAIAATGWGASTFALNYIWYAQFEKSPMHSFNDAHEWNQMDKAGHFMTAYQLAYTTSDLYAWSGLNRKQSTLIGGLFSFGYLTTVELLDGTNEAWGFSWSDMGFNTLGAVSASLQHYYDIPEAFAFKFSYHHTDLAAIRPSVLGSDFSSRLLKDYNGQTYWMSFNPLNWMKKETKIPKWLSLSVGYGTENQLYGNGDTYIVVNNNEVTSYTPYRQLFLSMDINFSAIETDKEWLKVIFKGLNMIKVPFPTVEFSQGNLSFHPLYF